MNKIRKHNLKLGFTLIELLIVIAVLGVLASVVLVAIDPLAQLAKARNAGRKSDLKLLADALERYKVMHGSYPNSGTFGVSWCDTANTGSYSCGTNNPLQLLISSGELKRLPVDPQDNKSFAPCDSPASTGYWYYSNGVDYKVIDHCGPEGAVYPCSLATEKFCDLLRPTYSWAVYSPSAAYW